MSKKILIVDDDESLREVYTVLFHQAGFEVLTAKDGQEAWDYLSAGRTPSVIFTGIIMPRMTGFDLIKRLKTDPALANIPVIVSSHRGLPEDKKTAEDLGVKEFVVRHMTTPGEVLRRVPGRYFIVTHRLQTEISRANVISFDFTAREFHHLGPAGQSHFV